MGVEKVILSEGNGVDFPSKGDKVTMEYTGWIYLPSAADSKGRQFDTSIGRGDLVTPIGEGKVIRGWDEGILGSESTPAMSLGEKATLTISADYGYGPSGFPGHIPPNASLVFPTLSLLQLGGYSRDSYSTASFHLRVINRAPMSPLANPHQRRPAKGDQRQDRPSLSAQTSDLAALRTLIVIWGNERTTQALRPAHPRIGGVRGNLGLSTAFEAQPA